MMVSCIHGAVTCSIDLALTIPKKYQTPSYNPKITKLKTRQTPVEKRLTFSKTQTAKMTFHLQIAGHTIQRAVPTVS
jgi:hypothetical protein